ncbi:hypothetical protein EV359DRAFT_68188 [Lentinula novae-zelandiae]|nr:hypothetical protein EV359DRAFT_68188 [Lentinula novae-zelandiae]
MMRKSHVQHKHATMQRGFKGVVEGSNEAGMLRNVEKGSVIQKTRVGKNKTIDTLLPLSSIGREPLDTTERSKVELGVNEMSSFQVLKCKLEVTGKHVLIRGIQATLKEGDHRINNHTHVSIVLVENRGGITTVESVGEGGDTTKRNQGFVQIPLHLRQGREGDRIRSLVGIFAYHLLCEKSTLPEVLNLLLQGFDFLPLPNGQSVGLVHQGLLLN